MLCLHCSPPTSDPRAPEQREPHSLLTDIDWAPKGLQWLSENRWPPAGQPPKNHRRQPRPSPEIRAPGHPRSRHSPRDCPSAQATTKRLTLAEEPDEYDPHPRQPSRERPAERQPATRQRRQLHHLRRQQRPYTILRSTGKSPALSRDPLPRTTTTERAPRNPPATRRIQWCSTGSNRWGRSHPKQHRIREPPRPGPPDTIKAVRPPQHHPAPTPHLIGIYYPSHAFPRQTNHQQRKPTRPPTTTTAATEIPAIAPVERLVLADTQAPPSSL